MLARSFRFKQFNQDILHTSELLCILKYLIVGTSDYYVAVIDLMISLHHSLICNCRQNELTVRVSPAGFQREAVLLLEKNSFTSLVGPNYLRYTLKMVRVTII